MPQPVTTLAHLHIELSQVATELCAIEKWPVDIDPFQDELESARRTVRRHATETMNPSLDVATHVRMTRLESSIKTIATALRLLVEAETARTYAAMVKR